MNKFKVYASLVFTLLAFFFAPLTFAGGQLVSLHADVNGLASGDIYTRVIRVYLHPEYTCKGTEITFKFVEPKDGDLITTGGSGPTYIMQEDRQPYYKNGVMGTTCSTYAKFSSKVSGERKVTVEVKNNGSVWHSPPVIKVHFDGKYHSDNHTNGESYRSSIEDPYFSQTSKSTPIPSSTPQPGSIYAKVGTERYNIGEPKRIVTISWNQVPNVVKYNVYARLAESKDYGAALLGTGGLSGEITINVALDYYVKVDACSNPGVCISSPEVYVGAVKQESISIGSPKSSDNPNSTISPAPNVDNKGVEELNKKVENLQNQLDQSKKTQSVLEQRINDLVNFIKRLFPFFK